MCYIYGKLPVFRFYLYIPFLYEKKDWYKVKKYSHIGLPLSVHDREWVTKYVHDEKKIAQHAFYPFIHRVMYKRKYRKSYDPNNDALLNKGKREKDKKTRELFYANHLDSNIFSYYSHKLSNFYEKELEKRSLETVVTAYRFIEHPKKKRGMNNVDFAEEIFSYIRKSQKNKLMAITFDIKEFFDNLNHKRIKESWKHLLGCSVLPQDHYNVFRNITNFSYIDIYDLFDEFKSDMLKREEDNIIRTEVQAMKYMRTNEVIAFCDRTDFNERVRKKGLIKSNKKIKLEGAEDKLVPRNKGVPQGSPISAFLANLYLLDFDTVIFQKVFAKGGIYRRYSDDIVIVCDYDDGPILRDLVLKTIKDYDLEIQTKKTNSYAFFKKNNKFQCHKILPDNQLSQRKRFSYLGFEFDGQYSYLKSGSLAKFYRSMKRAIKRGGFYSVHTKYKQDKGKIFRRRLYKRFSYLGSKRKIIWEYNEEKKKWYKRFRHDWGNYITYADMSRFNMGDNKIRQQISRHWKKLNNMIKKIEEENCMNQTLQSNHNLKV